MKYLLKRFSLIALCFITIPHSYAKVKLPAIVASNMILQRNTTVKLWGWADANEAIYVKLSWTNVTLNIEANNEGYWETTVKTNNSKTPKEITITSIDSHIVLNNILFGEVWLCSGQSNMFQPLKGYPAQPTFEGSTAILNAKNANLRLFTVDNTSSKTKLSDLKTNTSWQVASPETAANFSAIGYFFGEKLQNVLDVPVGIIHSSWGGSKIEAWMSEECFLENAETPLRIPKNSNRIQHTPNILYNAMIHPLTSYKIKGVLWYQGESNRLSPKAYKTLFPSMVKDWRTRWNIGDFPFYYVQIAPFLYAGNERYDTFENTAFFREAQLECLALIPNSGMAITLDAGHPDFIHPPQKKEIAYRLLYNALHKTYGYSTIDCATPIFKSKQNKDKGLLLFFENAEDGLYTYGTLKDFEIAGKDRIFYPAKAKIVDRRTLYVKSEAVPRPVAVRYAWKNWVKGSLFTTSLLPVSSFRTDHWPDATQKKQD
jgi:sialate O-acetylesterase